MSDDEEVAKVKRSNDRWIVLALTISAFLLAWLLRNHLDSIHEIRERHRHIDREIDGNLPKDTGRSATPANVGPPRVEVRVEAFPDGRTRISVLGDQARWWLPPRDGEANERAREEILGQLTAKLAEAGAQLDIPRATIHTQPKPSSAEASSAVMFVLDALLAADIRDVALDEGDTAGAPLR